jgi:hypothetical protein
MRKVRNADDITVRMIVLILVCTVLTLLMLLVNGCIIVERRCVPEYRYVDIETYKTWGVTNMAPIGRRKIPANLRVCTDMEAQTNITCPRHSIQE